MSCLPCSNQHFTPKYSHSMVEIGIDKIYTPSTYVICNRLNTTLLWMHWIDMTGHGQFVLSTMLQDFPSVTPEFWLSRWPNQNFQYDTYSKFWVLYFLLILCDNALEIISRQSRVFELNQWKSEWVSHDIKSAVLLYQSFWISSPSHILLQFAHNTIYP